MKFSSSATFVILTASKFTSTLSWCPSYSSTSRKFPLFMSSSSSETSPTQTTSPRSVNNNIVLRPTSDNPSAFDSLKLGNPRVHRYARDSSVAKEDTEYIMWYHGRSQSFDQEFKDSAGEGGEDMMFPPFSTGRIGRATSKNGLHWEKCTDEPLGASLAEDRDDVSVGLNTDSWWSFDTSHVGLGQVLLPMSNPAVITEGGVYSMYYMGGTYEETDMTDYVSLENLPPGMEDKKMKGMKMRIGVALSQDGKAWGRIEGDDPSGAIMVPYDKSDTSQKLNNDDSSASIWEVEEELYCAWPDVYVNLNTKRKEPAFSMYYSTMTKHGKEKAIARAVSEDGFRWFKRGVCVRPGVNGSDVDGGNSKSSKDDDGYDPQLDAAGCARCTAFKNLAFIESKDSWELLPKKNAPWIMYYEGVSSIDKKHRILKAESEDGFTWKKKGILLDVGEGDDAWDCNGVGTPHVSRMDDGSTRMYYTGQGIDGSTAIGVARTNEEGVFVREQVEITFA